MKNTYEVGNNQSINTEVQSVDRAFLMKLVVFNQSAFRSADCLPEDVAKEYGYEVLQDKLDNKTDYYAIVFKKIDANEIIIVHRGTLMDGVHKILAGDWSFRNLATFEHQLGAGVGDDVRLTIADMPKQAFQAISFVNYITSLYPDYKIIQTGHSLGGYLAQVGYWACDIETHAFDCPGAYDSLKNLFPDVEPVRKNPIKYYSTYPPCAINSNGSRLYASDKLLYEIVLIQYSNNQLADTNLIRLSAKSYVEISFDQHETENIIANLNMNCTIKNSENSWPSNLVDSYKRYLSIENEPYWQDQFKQLNLPEDKRWQLFEYFKAKYLQPQASLDYASALLIENITTEKLLEDFEAQQYVVGGGSWILYKLKSLASYVKNLL